MSRMRRLVLACAIVAVATGPAVGGGLGDDHGDDDAVVFFGVVKDPRGVAIPDAIVSLTLKNMSFITRADVLGSYKIGTTLDPDLAEISCRKDGFRQVGTTRRPPPAGAKSPIEVDCTMQRGVQ